MALMDWVKKAARRTLDNRASVVQGPTSSSASAPASEPAPSGGDVTTRFDNHGEIARGGMGAILRVTDRRLLRTLAMKVLEPEDGQKNDMRAALFLEEAQITSQLDHPNICPIQEYGSDANGTHFFTMKLVRGRTLSQMIHEPGYDPSDPRCFRPALDVLLRVCDALAFAHSRGVLHRDLKPENIMVGDFGQVYLMDWGVAQVMARDLPEKVRVSRLGSSPSEGAIVGTLMYMAPEQARGGEVDERTDVFGLGAILYEILTEVPPYYAQTLGDLVLLAQGGHWRGPQEMCGEKLPLPAALCAICEKAMAPAPQDRYQSVLEMKGALDEFLVGGMSFPTRTVAAGECLITEGELGDTAFIIQRGYCRVYKNINGENVAIADFGPGDVFGEAGVFADVPRTATVQALTDVTVQIVHKQAFEKDLGMASAMGVFVKALAKRFVETHSQLTALREQVQTSSADGSAAPAAGAPRGELVDAVAELQRMAAVPGVDVGALLVEALVKGTRALGQERAGPSPAPIASTADPTSPPASA